VDVEAMVTPVCMSSS